MVQLLTQFRLKTGTNWYLIPITEDNRVRRKTDVVVSSKLKILNAF